MSKNSHRYDLKLNGKLKVSVTDIPHCEIVVPVSGGKDSQACLKMAIEEYGAENVIGLFCDTKWEHPLTYQHVKNLGKIYEVDIYWINAGSVEQMVQKYKRFPASNIRFCTSKLKIEPSKWFYADLSERFAFQVWYGMRSGESNKRKSRYAEKENNEIYPPHEVLQAYPQYLGKRGVRFKLPILSWSDNQVFNYLDGLENPLYASGFRRVGCFPCLASTPNDHKNSFNIDDFGNQQKQRIIKLELIINKKHDPARTEQMCMFCQI